MLNSSLSAVLTTKTKNTLSLIKKRDVLVSFAILLCLWLFYSASLFELFSFQDSEQTQSSLIDTLVSILNDDYVRHIVKFSFFQAFLSALLSIGSGLLVAHAIYHNEFIGKRLLIKIFSLSMVLPVLVTIFGLLAVYGKSGFINDISQYIAHVLDISLEWRPNIYGLTGILLAHVFFNMPLSAKVLLHALSTIPEQQKKLANQLNMRGWDFVRLVELPQLRPQLPALFVLIFMLCFTSFTVVLVMGGSPKYTTLEVAIYQAVVFDFELALASMLALLQFVFCFALFTLSNYLTKTTEISENIKQNTLKLPTLTKPWHLAHKVIIAFTVFFIGLPLLSIIISSMNIDAWQVSLANTQLYKAFGFSIGIALCAGVLSLLLAMGLLLGSRQFYWLGFAKVAHTLVNMGMMVLAIPTLVLAVGLFLWLRSVEVNNYMLFAIVVFCNALMSMPFALRLLSQPFYNNMNHYEKLCQSLNITGLARLRYVEWHALKRPMLSALALTIALSLGDFTAIALFGTQDFTSLPHLLYQQLGSYRHDQAGVTAFILLALCMAIFSFVESDSSNNSDSVDVNKKG